MATWSSARQLCGVYGGQFDLSSLPSNTWQIACVLYGGGCVLLGFSGLAALVCLLLPPHGAKRLACYTGYLQTMAGNTTGPVPAMKSEATAIFAPQDGRWKITVII